MNFVIGSFLHSFQLDLVPLFGSHLCHTGLEEDVIGLKVLSKWHRFIEDSVVIGLELINGTSK